MKAWQVSAVSVVALSLGIAEGAIASYSQIHKSGNYLYVPPEISGVGFIKYRALPEIKALLFNACKWAKFNEPDLISIVGGATWPPLEAAVPSCLKSGNSYIDSRASDPVGQIVKSGDTYYVKGVAANASLSIVLVRWRLIRPVPNQCGWLRISSSSKRPLTDFYVNGVLYNFNSLPETYQPMICRNGTTYYGNFSGDYSSPAFLTWQGKGAYQSADKLFAPAPKLSLVNFIFTFAGTGSATAKADACGVAQILRVSDLDHNPIDYSSLSINSASVSTSISNYSNYLCGSDSKPYYSPRGGSYSLIPDSVKEWYHNKDYPQRLFSRGYSPGSTVSFAWSVGASQAQTRQRTSGRCGLVIIYKERWNLVPGQAIKIGLPGQEKVFARLSDVPSITVEPICYKQLAYYPRGWQF